MRSEVKGQGSSMVDGWLGVLVTDNCSPIFGGILIAQLKFLTLIQC